MKKVLFATTALVAFAGAAAADVTLSGSAEMGIVGGTNAETLFMQSVDVRFRLSGATDNGLSFGATIDLDDAGDVAGAAGLGDVSGSNPDFTVFISGDFGSLTMGDTDGAYDWAMGEVPNGPGSINDAETGHAGFNGNSGLDGTYNGQILRYNYSVSGFGIAVSAELDETVGATRGEAVMGLGLTYSGDMAGTSYRVALGYQSAETAAGVQTTITGLSLGGSVGDLDLGMNYSVRAIDGDNDDIEHVGVGVAYSLDAWSFGVNYGEYDNVAHVAGDSKSGVGASVGYDLGGGASLLLGYGSSESVTGVDTDAWSFGLSMSF